MEMCEFQIPCNFWLIWFINQKALYYHALSIVVGVIIGVSVVIGIICAPPPVIGLYIETSYLVCPPYMHIKYLVILNCRF